MAPAEFFACVFLFQQTIIFWIYLFPPIWEAVVWPRLHFSDGSKKSCWFFIVQPFQFVRTGGRFHTLYMPDWNWKSEEGHAVLKWVQFWANQSGWSPYWSGDLRSFRGSAESLGHDFLVSWSLCFFSVKRERVDFWALYPVYQIWFSLCWVFLRQVISGPKLMDSPC